MITQVTTTPLSPTYTCSTSGIYTPIDDKTLQTLCVLTVPATGVKTVRIQDIFISHSAGWGAGPIQYDMRVSRCTSADGITMEPTPHDLSDDPASASFYPASFYNTTPTVDGLATNPFLVFSAASNFSDVGSSVDVHTHLTAADFPGGKPITLRAGNAEGIAVQLYLFSGTESGQGCTAVAITWTED